MHLMVRSALLIILCSVGLWGAPGWLYAATSDAALGVTEHAYWTGSAGNGNWFDSGNWVDWIGEPIVPGANVVVHFNYNASNTTVSLGGDSARIQAMFIETDVEDLAFVNGSLAVAGELEWYSWGEVRIDLDLSAHSVLIAGGGHLRVIGGRLQATHEMQVAGSLLSISDGGEVNSGEVLYLVGGVVNASGKGSVLDVQAVHLDYGDLPGIALDSGAVIRCTGPAGRMDLSGLGFAAAIAIGGGGAGPTPNAPGHVDCPELHSFGAWWHLEMKHDLDGYRIERPDGTPLLLTGGMGVWSRNGIRSVLVGDHPTGGWFALEYPGTVLELDGSYPNAYGGYVRDGATLTARGHLGGLLELDSGGSLRVGDSSDGSSGSLRVGHLEMAATAALYLDLAEPGSTGGLNDLLQVDGDGWLQGAVHIEMLGDYGRYRLIEIGGQFDAKNLSIASLPAGVPAEQWRLEISAGGDIDLLSSSLLEIEPSPLQLLSVEGETSSGSVTLRNAGGEPLQVSILGLPSDVAFSQEGDSCGEPPFELVAAQSCSLTYEFAPLQPGAFSASVALTSDATDGPDAFSLEGVASRLPPLLVPKTLDFGEVDVLDPAALRDLTLENPSAAGLGIDSISPTENLEFSLGEHSCGNFVPATGSCLVEVHFQPLATGPSGDVLGIETEVGRLEAGLQGVGVAIRIFDSGFELLDSTRIRSASR